MKYSILSIPLLFAASKINAQSVNFNPEVVFGHRSLSYQNFVSYSFDKNWSLNNISIYDTEYNNDLQNIFFIRNMLSYQLIPNLKINVAIGVKNPGTFATMASQYQYRTASFNLSYTIGSTYQNGFTLEQTLILNYSPPLSKSIKAYLNLFAVVNTDLKIVNRGIQQIRIGLKKEKLITGMAVNLDQFTKEEKTLANSGIFVKYNF